jgi:MFS family permease
LAITNIASLMGRIVMGLLADKHGSFNLLILTTVVVTASLCAVVSAYVLLSLFFAISRHSPFNLLTTSQSVSMFYGFSSGPWVSLLISELASLAIRATEIG